MRWSRYFWPVTRPRPTPSRGPPTCSPPTWRSRVGCATRSMRRSRGASPRPQTCPPWPTRARGARDGRAAPAARRERGAARGAPPRGLSPARLGLHAHGDRRNAAPVPAGLDHEPAGDRGRYRVRLPYPRRRDGLHKPLRDPARSGPLGEPRGLRPRSVRPRTFGRTRELRVLPVRRRATPVHRQGLRADGIDARACPAGAALRAAPRARPKGRDGGGGHASSALRYVDDGASALNDKGSDRCYLAPLRAQYGDTAGSREQRERLRYADSETYGNAWQQVSADRGSEGRGGGARREPPAVQ